MIKRFFKNLTLCIILLFGLAFMYAIVHGLIPTRKVKKEGGKIIPITKNKRQSHENH